MIYEDILKAFADYIREQDYFDIVYSEKIGYIWIAVDNLGISGTKLLNTPMKMLDVLFEDVINEVAVSSKNTIYNSDPLMLTKSEARESRSRLTTILNTIENGKNEYIDYLNRYLDVHQGCFSA